MYAYAHQPHRLVDENVIDSQYRKSGWERANGWRRLNEFAHIAQMAIKCAIWSRTAETVEVAEQDERCVTGNGCAPLGTGKQLCLNEAFNPREMDEAENLHRDTCTFHQLDGASVYRDTSERILKKMHFHTVTRAFSKGFSKSVRDFAFAEQKIFKCNCALRRTDAIQHCGKNLIAVLQRCNFVSFLPEAVPADGPWCGRKCRRRHCSQL